MNGRVSVKKVLVVVQIAQAVGMHVPTLCAKLGLTPEALSDPEGWLPQHTWRSVWLEVVAQTDDPTIALKAARQIDRGYFGVIDYIARSSDSMGSAIEAAARYFRLANTQGHLRLSPVGGGLRISRHLAGDEHLYLPRQAAEFALATMTRVFQGACARPWSLTEVTFRYPAPADPARFTAFFGCPVRFSAPQDALVVSHAVLTLPMAAPDARLHALVASHGEALLGQLPADSDLLQEVRAMLVAELAGGMPGIDQVAARMGMSRRTLQRQLTAAGVRFRDLCEEMRRALAVRYLEAGVSLGETAFLLGYSEVTAFHRAFRRWSGHSPGTWRKLAPDARRSALDASEGERAEG